MGKISRQRNTIILLATLLVVSAGINIVQHNAISELLDAENSREVVISQDILEVLYNCK